MSAAEKTVPAPIYDDGFDGEPDTDRMIQGVRYVCDITKPEPWLQQPGSIPVDVTREKLVMTSRTVLRRWQNNRVIDTKIKCKDVPFPSADELNDEVPREQWQKGPSGELQGPWQKAWFVYLLDVQSGERATFVTTSIGGSICVTELRENIAWMRKLRGHAVAPIVLLKLKPFPTKYGMKQQPWLRPVRWVGLGTDAGIAEQLEHKPELKALPDAAGPQLKDVKPISTKEAINDELPPWNDDDR
jgi:hypothetical protein